MIRIPFEGASATVDRYPTLLTVHFRETGPSSTEITLRQDQLLSVEDREGNREGWRLCFDKLQAVLGQVVNIAGIQDLPPNREQEEKMLCRSCAPSFDV